VIHRRLATPLHATRALVGSVYCLALGLAALLSDDPIVLAVLVGTVLAAAVLAGVGREVRRAMRWSLLLALFIALLNPLFTREGLTVIWRFGEIPPFGQVDVTLEALTYGLVLGVRVVAIVGAGALFALVVDPDALLRMFRRISFRSALTAVLATRLVPVVIADGRRLAEAQRCRADGGGDRLAVVRAVASGALDRAVDVAATLEVRGYAIAARPPRGLVPWSRHDVAFLASAVVLVALAIVARATGLSATTFYPELDLPTGPATWGLAAAMAVVALLPFLNRRGIEP
jgi:energy-coupling factor transport system permease protein